MTEPGNRTEPQKSPISLAIAAVAVALVLVVGVAVGLALNNSDEEKEPEVPPAQQTFSISTTSSPDSESSTSSSTSSTTSTSSSSDTSSESSTSTESTSETTSETSSETAEPDDDGFNIPNENVDGRGWVNSSARCGDGDRAFAVLATDKGTTTVACERNDGSKYYRGDASAGSLEAPIIVDEGDRIVAQNGDWKYQMSPDRLVVTKNNETQSIEGATIWGRK
ncbi:hypothetical protein [Corynebacterium sp. H78]|uniref:hypothetical protein n=1 Tax=Corynebacterium sp. H78 TaxID=3133417 RepID=UPI0030AF5BC4